MGRPWALMLMGLIYPVLSEEVIRKINEIWAEHLVLKFPGQMLADQRLVALSITGVANR